MINAPQAATHCRIVAISNVLSEYAYSVTVSQHEPTDKVNNSKYDLAASEYIELGGMVGVVSTITMDIPGAPTLPATSALIASVGIEFYQEVNGQMYLLLQSSCMKTIEVF